MIQQKYQDQQIVENFLKEFVEKLIIPYRKDIDFILLFGSAARGEWKKGVSDIDLIIQCKIKHREKEISGFAQKIFWELDEKYQTKFNQVCCIGEKDAIDKALKEARLYVPFEVFGPNDIDWQKGQIKKPELFLGAQLVASQATLFKKMKEEGKILYGRDIRKEIRLKISFWEKWKALFVPFYLSLSSVILALISPKKALKIAQKATLYGGESVLFFLDLPYRTSTKATIDELEKEFISQIKTKYHLLNFLEVNVLLNFDWRKPVDFEFIKEALRLKYDWENASEKFNHWQIIKFCLRSFLFVNKMNWYAIWRMKNKK